ncbi:MAG: carbohydrate kinase family protein [Planctomycetaceae bacterium]|nr:carbohydrate kinase family protein [Planctomycetaceae bacterium]
MAKEIDALVVGLLCLDIIPEIPTGGRSMADLLLPGKLVDIGAAVMGTGGAASNTGLALHRLGFAVHIVGKVGDDVFGGVTVDLLKRQGSGLADSMIVSKGDASSYSIIIDPPGIDRMILHDPAANHTFRGDEVPDETIASARLLHFGYPPLMRRFYENDGEELSRLFRRARATGVTTSLDMARPDPDGPSGKIDWVRYCETVLPDVDVFLPSADEILFMIDRPAFDALQAEAGDANPAALMDIATIRAVADRLLAMGTAIVGLKLGDQGFYLKTTADPRRLAAMGRLAPDAASWLDTERIAPCRLVEVAGTIGAGDCTIAGFLGSLLKGLGPDEAVAMATAVGGASVEARDAYSGVTPWPRIVSRLESGWPQRDSRAVPASWRKTPAGNFRP